MQNGGLDKRSFLKALCCSAATGFGGLLVGCARTTPSDQIFNVVEPIKWQPAVESLAKDYFQQQADENNLQVISDRLFMALKTAGLEVDAVWQVSDRLKSLNRMDYEKNHMVELSGWFLSRTEIRLLAMAYMLMLGNND